ncbi:TonB family C-terminal domain-containing protein [Arenibacter nanhaiticus]|uniref:TonB family C-terminal domain-containing protein n=1 Tax=Arenibacter nanhaiticus TaxID=558155 RepID=A0A1M6IN80_9FLAO|nr:M56 family metallopeptidase [Arenibacter nanhaiticus]SHJ35905.1 TonB family C-terminal domain-containing protein [Arenibacter nanhaiticus]
MIQYILECVAFQLLFLIVYDLFLKRETFFQWNRAYLLGSFILSILLPWIKIEALKTTVSQDSFVYPEYLWDMDMSSGFVGAAKPTVSFHLSTTEMVLYGGMIIAAGLFVFKLYQIVQLKRKGEIRYFESFTRVMVRNSQMAFSFFRSIFLGDQVLEKDHDSIIQHELVHIEQRHSWDLLFFELMRIVAWFNPLVYVYQSRISELHEFIADAKVAKIHKEEQYQMLLSQVFHTQNISFINHFYASSLIKKRIVMLQKTKSKQIFKLKYLVLIPLVIGMLIYTSCESEVIGEKLDSSTTLKAGIETILEFEDLNNLSKEESLKKVEFLNQVRKTKREATFIMKDRRGQSVILTTNESGLVKMDIRKDGETDTEQNEKYEHANYDGPVDIPFAVVEKVPVFPGCEGAEDKRACFNDMMYKHISKNFRYPEVAQENGIQGRVSVMFIIGVDGSISNAKMRGPDKLLEEEAARIVSQLPQMTPGEQKGKKVRVPYSIPITFKLQ